ncbi:hypothetical protein Tsubulata_010899 [Turnera subulata]|uniref:Protein PHYTOCHROME KINASE SUBSTRATE 4 n=1 Tax=Turnera subulata TaxID=218843 RepID=A0A9Q0FVY2_9ROSI|nr:hypothetical protein Tsubulata_010899 [Turnera subulata]
MERTTVIKTIPPGGGVPQKPIFDIKQHTPPPAGFPLPQKTAVKDVSFSSYIKPEPNNQVVDDSEISIFDAQKYFNDGAGEAKMMSKRVSPVDGNVTTNHFSSVPPRFSSASSSVDGYGRNYRASSFHATPTASSEASWNSQTGLLSNPPGAIAVSMRNPPRGDDRRRGSSSSSSRWLLGGRCPCSGKKSVQVEEKLSSEPRTPSRSSGHNSKVSLNLIKTTHQIPSPVANTVEKRLITPADWLERREVVPVVPTTTHRISADNNRFTTGLAHHHHRVSASGRVPFTDGANGFTFPILSQTPTPAAVKVGLNVLRPSSTNHNPPPPPPSPPLEDPARDSLEVFQPVNDLHHHHRRHSFTTAADDDMLSDASSDLFEIESFSTQTTTYPMYNIMNRRDSLDDASSFNTRSCLAAGGGGGINGGGILHCRQSLDVPSVAPTECYEPSEASFDWSVTTAEGFDRGSVTNFSVTASEVEEMNMMRHHHHVGGDHQKHNSGGGGKRKGGNGGGGGGLLMSCRCEKAVSVGPHPVKCVATEGQRGVSSTTRHVSSRPPPPPPPQPIVSSKPPLARSHSARLSLPFAT